MKKSLTLFTASCLCFTALLHSQEPVLDIRFSSTGKAKDISKLQIPVESTGTVESSAGEAILRTINAVTIPFDEKHPLFRAGAFTWIFSVLIENPKDSPISFGIAGRWVPPADQRAAAIFLGNEAGTFGLNLAADGSTEALVGAALKVPTPANQWVSVVVRFEPEDVACVQLFDDGGKMLGESRNAAGIPKSFYNAPVPFLLGATPEIRLHARRFAAWDTYLGNDQIKKFLSDDPTKKPTED